MRSDDRRSLVILWFTCCVLCFALFIGIGLVPGMTLDDRAVAAVVAITYVVGMFTSVSWRCGAKAESLDEFYRLQGSVWPGPFLFALTLLLGYEYGRNCGAALFGLTPWWIEGAGWAALFATGHVAMRSRSFCRYMQPTFEEFGRPDRRPGDRLLVTGFLVFEWLLNTILIVVIGLAMRWVLGCDKLP